MRHHGGGPSCDSSYELLAELAEDHAVPFISKEPPLLPPLHGTRTDCCRGQRRLSPRMPTRRKVNAGPGCDLIQEPVSG